MLLSRLVARTVASFFLSFLDLDHLLHRSALRVVGNIYEVKI